MMAIHVDGMVLAGMKMDCDGLREYRNKYFLVNDVGNLNNYAGCMFERDRKFGTITVSQLACIERLLIRSDFTASSRIPAFPIVELRPSEAEVEDCSRPFREAIWELTWVPSNSRPDMARAVSEVARYSHNSSKKHWTAVVKILKYRHATKDLRLRHSRNADPSLFAYAGATYASSTDESRLVSGGGGRVRGCGYRMVQ